MLPYIDHISIQTKNFYETYEFYIKFFNFKVIKEPYLFKKRTLCILNAGNINIELYSSKNEPSSLELYHDKRAGLDHFAFVVDNIFDFIENLRKNNINIIKEPFCPPTNDQNQPLIAFIEGPDLQEIEIREKK